MTGDILIGIPSYNEAATIGHVVRQVDAGLAAHFPEQRCLIANFDNHSTDGTRDAFAATSTLAPKRYISTPPGVRGKGHNVRNFLRLADDLGVTAAALVDADLESIMPRWIPSLLDPVMQDDADFVFPHYRTSQLGPLTRTLCHPMVYGLFAADVDQPIAGEFAFSAALIRRLLEAELPSAARSYGIDIFLTTEAVIAGARLCGVELGYKLHRRRAWTSIGPLVAEVTEALLGQIGRHLQHLRDRQAVCRPQYLAGRWPAIPMTAPTVDLVALTSLSLDGIVRHTRLYAAALPDEEMGALNGMVSTGQLDISSERWCTLLYALVCDHLSRGTPLRRTSAAVLPLFFGRLVSWVQERETSDYQGDEAWLLGQAETFFRNRGRVLGLPGPTPGTA